MSVKLRIEFSAGVVMVDGNGEVAGCAVGVGAVLAYACGGVSLQFFERFNDGLLVCVDEPFVAADNSNDRNRFRRRDGEVVKMPSVGLFGSIGTKPVGALPLPKKVTGVGIEPLTECFKVFGLYFA